MGRHIASELKQIMNLPQSELDITYMFFLDFIKDWWQHENFYLKDSNPERTPL